MLQIVEIAKVVGVGVGATVVMDIWSVALKRLGIPTLAYALVGRWAGHMLQRRFFHTAIARAAPVQGESALGWTIHYAVGIVFAALLVGLYGMTWLHTPTLLPAFVVGTGTVIVPLFVMQPCMGAGFAASRTPSPLKNCLRSVATHAVFGCGLYLSAAVLRLAGA